MPTPEQHSLEQAFSQQTLDSPQPETEPSEHNAHFDNHGIRIDCYHKVTNMNEVINYVALDGIRGIAEWFAITHNGILLKNYNGGNLRQRLQLSEASEERKACWITQIFDTVSQIHARGISIRDIDLQKFLLTSSQDIQMVGFSKSQWYRIAYERPAVAVSPDVDDPHLSFEADMLLLIGVFSAIATWDENLLIVWNENEDWPQQVRLDARNPWTFILVNLWRQKYAVMDELEADVRQVIEDLGAKHGFRLEW